MNQDEKPNRSSRPENKKINRKVFIGTAAALLFGGTAFGVTKLNQGRSETTMYQADSQKEGTEETVPSRGTVQDTKTPEKSEIQEETSDKTPAILEHYGIIQPDTLNDPDFPARTQLKPVDLALVATTIKESVAHTKEDVTTPVSNEYSVEKPSILDPTVPSETPTDPESPSVVDSAPVWVGPKIYPLIQSPVVQQGSYFQASDYYYVSTGSQADPVITTTSIDTSIVGTQQLTITATDSQGYSDTLTIPIYVNSQPVLTVSAEETTIPVGSTIDLLSFVSASDLEDGDLSSKVTYTTDLDPSVEGVYTVYYSFCGRENPRF